MDKPPIGADCASAAMVNLPIARIFASRSFIIGGSLPFGRLIRSFLRKPLSLHTRNGGMNWLRKKSWLPGPWEDWSVR